jgi:hypothetical protein
MSGWFVLIAIGSVVILSGIVIIVGRVWMAKPSNATSDPDSTLVRSWIAISLVAGLLVFCAVAFSINDSSLRSTLFGGLVASVGAAVAFYFSAKGADKARQDILSAALGTADVPNLITMTLTDAREAISKTPFQLVPEDPHASTDDIVATQSPDAGTNLRTDRRFRSPRNRPLRASLAKPHHGTGLLPLLPLPP